MNNKTLLRIASQRLFAFCIILCLAIGFNWLFITSALEAIETGEITTCGRKSRGCTHHDREESKAGFYSAFGINSIFFIGGNILFIGVFYYGIRENIEDFKAINNSKL